MKKKCTKVLMMLLMVAVNLYCNGTPSVYEYEDTEEQLSECREYTDEEVFCCSYL